MLSWCAGGVLALLVGVQGDTSMINMLLKMHRDRTAQKLNETTLDAAWKFVEKKKILDVKHSDLHRHIAGGRRLRHGFQGLQLDATLYSDASTRGSPSKGYGAVDSAIQLINDMISEADEKYDDELQNCCKFDFTQTGLMNETRVAIAWANKRAAEASEKILDSRAGIESCKRQLPISYLDMHRWNEQCTAQIAKLDKMIDILVHDIAMIGEIIIASGCEKSGVVTQAPTPAPTTGFLLYECTDECGTYETVDAPGKKMTPHMRAVALQLFQSKNEDFQPGNANMTTTTVAPRTSRSNTPCQQKRTLDPMAANCKLPKDSKNCPPLLEKFTDVQTGLLETQREKEAKRADTKSNCDRVHKDFVREIAGLEQQLRDWMTLLASATATKNSADEVSRTKGIQLVEMIRSYKEMTKECHANYDELENEICALTKIRMSVMMKINGKDNPAFYQDCKVSPWVDVEPGCSLTCGGGVVKRHRTIQVYPVGGTKCPHLTAVATCNTDKCPIDCKVGDWSGWSDCSARECGGGVQDRTRPVDVEPMYGGETCGETEEVRNCNVQACDAPCKLSDWTAWTNCSKPCNHGHTDRIRTILEPAVGEGDCWEAGDAKRLQTEVCNTGPCPVLAGQLLQCQSAKDVVVLIDGSGSVGDAGWKLEIKAAQMLRKAVDPKPEGSSMAVVVFSGPEFLCDYYWCVSATETYFFTMFCGAKKTEDFDCGTTRVSEFSADSAALEKKINEAEYPARTTFTAKALGEVESMLNMGNKDAEAVVIVLTDGYPADKKATAAAAMSLNKKAKVIWVPITSHAPLGLVKEWAANPENVIPVDDFVNLDSKTMNDIIATACGNIKAVEYESTTTTTTAAR